MLAAVAMAATLAAGPKTCAADLRLNAEQIEQKLDAAALSPPSARPAERTCLVQAAAHKLTLDDPLNALAPDVAPELAIGRAALFQTLAERLRALCPAPSAPGDGRPKICGRRRALRPPPLVIPIDQTEQGFILWLRVEPDRARQARKLAAFLARQKLDRVAPFYQILRTASDWQVCGGEPFALPPDEDWPRAAKTLDWINRRVKPAIGPVEVVSGYREPALNACAQGAKESAHLGFWALDLEPIDPTLQRPALMDVMCRTHAQFGQESDIGLGFYAGVRFHVDDKRFRHWGFDPVAAQACAAPGPAP